MRLSLFHAPKWMCARTVNSVSALGQINGTCSFHASTKRQKVLSVDNMNPFVKNMEYAVRGPIVIQAGEIEEELKKVHSFRYLLCNLMSNFKIQILCNCSAVHLILIKFLHYACQMSLLVNHFFTTFF